MLCINLLKPRSELHQDKLGSVSVIKCTSCQQDGQIGQEAVVGRQGYKGTFLTLN